MIPSVPLADTGEGPFLRTGDLGFLADDGDLVFVERIKDLIVINGQNYVCHDLESTAAASHELLAADGIAAIAVETENGPHLLLIAEFPPEALDRAERAAQAIRGARFTGHGLALRIVALVPPGKLNRTTSGSCNAGSAPEFSSRAACACLPSAAIPFPNVNLEAHNPNDHPRPDTAHSRRPAEREQRRPRATS
jgi:hypothetical protein